MSGFTKEKLSGLNQSVTMMIGSSNQILSFHEKWLRMGFFKRIWWIISGRIR
jgi:hypothetical protein